MALIRNRVCLGVVCMALLGTAAAADGVDIAPKPAVELTVTREGDGPDRPYGPVWLRVRISNHSQERVSLMEHTPWGAFRFAVTVQRGEDGPVKAPLTAFGRFFDGREERIRDAGFNVDVYVIEPGAKMERLLPINRYFDMTLEGEYAVKMNLTVLSESGKRSKVVSGPLKVVVKLDGIEEMKRLSIPVREAGTSSTP